MALLICAHVCAIGFAEAPASTGGPRPGALTEEEYVDFTSEDTFFDISDALKSKQYVRRAILSSVIKTTSTMTVDRYYVNHIMGFNAVLQRKAPYTKYVTGVQGIAAGYVAGSGHGVEVGLELSAVSALYAGYRYFYRPENFSLWISPGGGFGTQMTGFSFAEGPPAAALYTGSKQFVFGVLTFMIPLVDVALKAELRFNFYSMDRLILTQAVGATLFL